MKKVNMFTAKKELATRVNEYMTKRVWSVVLRSRMKDGIKRLDAKIDALRDESSTVDKAARLDGIIKLMKERAELTEKVNEQVKNEATLELTDTDKAFLKAYKAAKNQKMLRDAVVDFCKAYDLDLIGKDLLAEICTLISGGSKATTRTIVQSGATTFTKDKRSARQILDLVYGRLAERMLKAGTLKAADIPEDVRAMYAKK